MRDPDDFDEPNDFGLHRTLHSPLHPDYVAPTNTVEQEHKIWRRKVRAAEAEERAEIAWELEKDRREEWGGRWG